jgi:hypothetical protein
VGLFSELSNSEEILERSSNISAAPVEETKRKIIKNLLSFIKHLEKFFRIR